MNNTITPTIACELRVVAAAFALCACVPWTPCTEASSLITLNGPGTTILTAVARDTALGMDNQIENLFPVSVPYDASHNAIRGTSHSFARYQLTDDFFRITSSGERSGLLDSRANVQPTIFFSVATDTPYTMTASLTVDDAGATGKAVSLETSLTDTGTLASVFRRKDSTFGVVDQAFSVGATGVLLGGHSYELFYGTSIYAANSGDRASYVGNFELRFSDGGSVPDGGSSLALLGLCLAGLGQLKRKLSC
jgi:hypothetical protein